MTPSSDIDIAATPLNDRDASSLASERDDSGFENDGSALTGTRAPRELVLASAGTGKTFRITSRLISLLAYGANPDEILASTFTRKAAGEILHRTLDRLARAALDDEAAGALAHHAAIPGALPLPEGRQFWQGLLERVVRRLHRLDVGTLDAYFVRAARAFEQELRMPPGWRIAEESTARRLRSRVLQDVIVSIGPAEMTEILRLVNRGEARRSVHLHLLGLVDDLVALEHELDPDLSGHWEALSRSDDEPAPDEAGRERLALALEAFEPPLTRGGKGPPDRRWVGAIAETAAAFRARDWTTVLSKGLCAKIIAGESSWHRISLDGIRPSLNPIIEASKRELRLQLVGQVSALGRFARAYAGALGDAQRVEGVFRFDDLTRLIGGPDPLGRRTDLYYRLDARTRHILLDEFQDTSLAQWEAISPIMDEVLSDDARACIIVADPKQSIYGWRGAEPKLVGHVGEYYGLERAPLHVSYRSSPVVLGLVNTVFGQIEGLPSLSFEPANQRAARDWSTGFAVHEAIRAELPGYVRLEAGPRDVGSGNQRPLLFRRSAERIAEIRRSAPSASIGVLTRTNGAVARLIFELRRQGLQPSEEGGNPLTDSGACEALLALVRLADHPGDSVARYHVAHSPLGAVVGLPDFSDNNAAELLATRIRGQLASEGYGPFLAGLTQRIESFCDDRERRRLAQLVQLGHRHDTRRTLRPMDFVSLVESERVEDPLRADVRVMTVHQAKGLEFDVVVLPELDYPLHKGIRSPVVPVRREPAGRVTAIYPNLKADFRGLFPEVQAAHEIAISAAVRDGLSTFYVALTRARHATFAIIAADAESGPSKALTPARIFREAVSGGNPAQLVDGDVAHEAGDPDWYRATRNTGGEAAELKLAESPGERSGVDGPTHGIDPDGQLDLLPGVAYSAERLDHWKLAVGPQIELDFEASPPFPSDASISSSEDDRSRDSQGPGAPIPAAPIPGDPIPADPTDAPLRIGFDRVGGGDQAEEPPASAPTTIRASASAGQEVELTFLKRTRTRQLQRRTPSRLEGGDTIDVRYLLRLDTARAMRSGSVVHAWLERIGWIDEGIPAESDLRDIAARTGRGAGGTEVEELLASFDRYISAPAIRDLLSRGTNPPGAEPTREVRFLHREGETLLEGSIDRLVLVRDGGAIVRAEVIDYKTDLIADRPTLLPDRVRYYQPQIAAYCRAVSAMYRLDSSTVTGKLVFLDVGRVVTVPPSDRQGAVGT